MQSVQSILPVPIVPVGASDPMPPEAGSEQAFAEVVDGETGKPRAVPPEEDCAAAAIWPLPLWLAGFAAPVAGEARRDGGAIGRGGASEPAQAGSADDAGPGATEAGADLPARAVMNGWTGDDPLAAQPVVQGRVSVGEGQVPDVAPVIRAGRQDQPSTDRIDSAVADQGQRAALGLPPDVLPSPALPGNADTAARPVTGAGAGAASSVTDEIPAMVPRVSMSAENARPPIPAGPETAGGWGSDRMVGQAGRGAGHAGSPFPGLRGMAGVAPAADAMTDRASVMGPSMNEARTLIAATAAPAMDDDADAASLPAAQTDGVPDLPALAASFTGSFLSASPASGSALHDHRTQETVPQGFSGPSAAAPEMAEHGLRIPPARATTEADAARRVSPGVWEQVFSGVIAPVRNDVTQTPVVAAARTVDAASPAVAALLSDNADKAFAHREMTEPKLAVMPQGTASPPQPSAVPGVRLPSPDASTFLDPQRDGSTNADLSGVGLAGLAATAPANPGASGATSAPSPVPFPVPQIAAQIGAALSQGSDGTTELALAPEELGKVRVRLKPDATHPDRLVVMITCDRPETLDLFRRHAGELGDAFRSAGYAGADIGFGQQGSGHADPGRREGTGSRSPDGGTGADPGAAAPPVPRLGAAASLDLRL